MIKLVSILEKVINEKEDRCKRIADRRYDKPSAYKSGAIVRCRQGKIWKELKEDTVEKDIKYSKPNLKKEWEEALRYPEFKELGKQKWIELGNQGYIVDYSDIEDKLGNVDLDFDNLERDKKIRFKKAYKLKTIEHPITVKFNDNSYDLVAGNTRLAGLVRLGVDPKIWVVDLSQLKEEESLRNWFKRQGAPGKTGGWVDCNAPIYKDGKVIGYKPCGRKKGEDRSKYPACRPTASRCKDSGKGKTWGRKK